MKQPPKVSGDEGGTGHLEELRADPIGLMTRVRDECGDVGEFRMADRRVVLLTGADANEFFFRAPEEDLDQAEAYPFMTPIFGKGVVFDASPEERQQMLKNQALRGDMMRGHARTIEAEIRRMVAPWGDEGEIDLLDWFAELTIYTTSSCLIGKPFREELDSSFAQAYHEPDTGVYVVNGDEVAADLSQMRDLYDRFIDSQATADDLTRFYGMPAAKIRVVYPGVDKPFIGNVAAVRAKFPDLPGRARESAPSASPPRPDRWVLLPLRLRSRLRQQDPQPANPSLLQLAP